MSFATLPEACGFLYGLRRQGVKWGLASTAAALRKLGSPQVRWPSIHVAGTNGKGSTAAMTASILKNQGYRVGLYTSPHLERFSERICVDGQEIPDGDFLGLLQEVASCGVPLSFFETATVLAFLHFSRCQVDVAVVETGLGGRLDATQWMVPVAGAVTSIGADHALALSGNLLRVAWEKASIAAPGVPLVVPRLSEETLRVLGTVVQARGGHLVQAGVDYHMEPAEPGKIRWQFGAEPAGSVRVPLLGIHQPSNCAMALTLARLFAGKPLDLTDPFAGFSLAGRMECIEGFWLDGAHNAPALAALAKTLHHEKLRLPVVLGMMADKDVDACVRILAPVARGFHCTQIRSEERVMPAEELARRVRDAQGRVLGMSGSVEACLAQVEPPALVTGSFYLVGAVRSILTGQKPPGRLLSDPCVR